MEQIEFNLLEQPWIRVRKPDCTVQEVSLTDALVHAHEFQDLAGELPTQDVALLRLMLAVLQTVFYRFDAEGSEAPLQSSEQALGRWKALWQLQRFSEKPIREYLYRWRERFWLFHPDRPFYQIPQAKIGTEYGAAKLNGEISESGNKLRLFSTYAKQEKTAMTYAQAARWLLYINGFDDKSSKAKGNGLPSLKTGWLGSLGLILAQGRNLMETLMLNLILLRDDGSIWEAPLPCWELEQPRCGERTQVPQPENAAQLLTLQSRRLLLQREGDLVTGYSMLSGDFFETENAFCEQMTLWRKTQEKKNSPVFYQPRRHDSEKQFWREFPAAFPQDEEAHSPGIVRWITRLQGERCLERQRMVHFKSVGIVYGGGSNESFIRDTFCDTLTFHLHLLDEMGRPCRRRVIAEIQNCEKLATQIGILAGKLALISGNEGVGQIRMGKEQFYFEIDQPFRRWLYQLDPQEDVNAAVESWREQAKKIARALGSTMVEAAGTPALVGRSIKDTNKIAKKISSALGFTTVRATDISVLIGRSIKNTKEKEKKNYINAPEAYNVFLYGVNQVYREGGGSV